MIGGHIIGICKGHILDNGAGKLFGIHHLAVTVRENTGLSTAQCMTVILHPTNYRLMLGQEMWWQGDMAFVTIGGREVRIPRLRVLYTGEVVTPGT